MPTNPSAPIVATSTADPSSIIAVTDTTPPSGKTISLMGSLGRCRTSLLVSGERSQVRSETVEVFVG